MILDHKRCRVCRQDLIELLHLGNLKLNAFPRHPWQCDQLPRVPLVLTICSTCHLVQLDRTVPQDWLYREYWYKSGVNEMMVEELRDIVVQALNRKPIGPLDYVLDIGANDGTLLRMYAELMGTRTPIRLAVEPAMNLAPRLRPHCDLLSWAYFPTPGSIVGEYDGKVSIITAIAMCYDLEDPVAFFEAIRTLLAPDGLAIVQFQDLGQQIESCAFDNICHEHLEYYTLMTLADTAAHAGLTVVDCRTTPINGGSLRAVLKRADQGPYVAASVSAQLQKEYRQGLQGGAGAPVYRQLESRIRQMQRQILSTVEQILGEGHVLDIYGASTKGNILLQVLGIGPEYARQAIDRSAEKHGCYTVTGIPIVGEATAREDPATCWLSPIWQFRPSVLARERWYLEQGGTIVFPLPGCEIVRERW